MPQTNNPTWTLFDAGRERDLRSGYLQNAATNERFYRGDAARNRDNGGSGISLTISRASIEAHGGTLTATSAGPDTGTTLTIRLPLARPSRSSSDAHPSLPRTR